MSLSDKMKFDSQGLLPAVVQDFETGQVLMVAYMDRAAVDNTFEKRLAHFYSRSRQKSWVKGESSGHTQEVKEIYYDCDADCMLVKVKQNGAACHVGYYSCFYRQVQDDGTETIVGDRVFNPDDVYSKK